jgi:maltose-binding protein MalE
LKEDDKMKVKTLSGKMVLFISMVLSAILSSGWAHDHSDGTQSAPLHPETSILSDATALVAKQKPIELIVMTFPSELTRKEIAAIEKENPDIRLKVVEYSNQLFELEIASGYMPDVIRRNSKQLPSMVKDGLLLDITDTIAHS